MTTQLPDAVNAGDEIEVQLAPRGTYPQIVDGEEVNQVVDDAAIKSLIDNFNAEKADAQSKGVNYQVLVDADHSSETGTDTAAMAWVDRLFDDPERGLVGVFVFTKEGADAVTGKKWRFISPAWTLTEDGHPEKLVSVGMTNKPNLPVSPMLNMRAVKSPKAGTVALNAGANGVTSETDEAKTATANVDQTVAKQDTTNAEAEAAQTVEASAEAESAATSNGETETTDQEEKSDMNPIKELLGLPAEATDEEVVQAVQALLAKCEGMEAVQNALGLDPTCSNEEVTEALNAVLEQSEALQNAACEAEKAKLNAEADQLVAENEDVIPEEAVESIKEEFVENPDAARETVANMRKVYERAVANCRAKAEPKKVSINFRAAKAPVAINTASMLAQCGGDPAKENEMLRQMAK